MKFGATLRAAAESARLHAHADRFVPYDELKAALRQPALAGPAEFLGELKLQMDDLNAHVGGCVEALEAIVAGAADFATLAKCVTESGALLAFAQLNATALRKLGTKYDKRRRERLESDTFGLPDSEITHGIDVTSVLGRKRLAIRAHTSQIPEDSFFLAMPDEAFAMAFGVEWYVDPKSPRGGKPQSDDLLLR